MASKIVVDPSDLSCSICLEVFIDPRALPCIHSFCYGCLEGWVKKSRSNKTVCCPLCKEVSPIPAGGLKMFKCNYFLADLVTQMDAIDLKSSHKGAEYHKEDVELIELSPIYCKYHPKNPIDQYCVDCDFAVCGTCLLRNHSQHNLVDISEQAKISSKQLKHILKQTTTMIQLIDEQIDDSNKYDKRSTTDITDIKTQINKVIDGMINKLNQQRTQLLSSLDTIEQQKEKMMMTVRDGQDFSKAEMTSLRSYTDNMLRHGRDYDRVQQVRDIKLRLASINKARIPSFVWNYHENKASSHDMTVARLSMKTDMMEIEGMGGDVRGSVAGAESVNDNILAKIPLVEPIFIITGLEVMGQTVWVVHNDQSSLYAYPITSPHRPQKFFIQGLSSPTDMVRFPPGQSQLVINDGSKSQILWIQLEPCYGLWKLFTGVWNVTSQRSVKVRYAPCGLGVHDNQLLVCDEDKVIHVLSTSGEETHRVNMKQGAKPYKAVAQLTSPGFVTMDFNKKQVILVTAKGKIQHTYRGQEGFTPGDIVCHGNSIYVIDFLNHHVDELSNDGRHVRQLISQDGVRCPSRICVDATGRLYVAQGDWGKREVWVIERTVTPTDTQATPGDRLLIHQTNMNLSVTWCE